MAGCRTQPRAPLGWIIWESRLDPTISLSPEAMQASWRAIDLNGRNSLFFEFGCMGAVRTEHIQYVAQSEDWHGGLFNFEMNPGERVHPVGKAECMDMRLVFRDWPHAFFDGRSAVPPDQRPPSRRRTLTHTGTGCRRRQA